MKLTEYAKTLPAPRKPAICCSLDAKTWHEIAEARAQTQPVSWDAISRWLVTHKGIARDTKGLQQALSRHLREEHQAKP